MLPFGAGTFSDRAVALVKDIASDTPAKHVTLISGGVPEHLETRAATVDDLLVERGIVRAPEDRVSADPASPLDEGETVTFRPAVPVTLVVDGVERRIRTPAATVRELLGAEGLPLRARDAVSPSPAAALGNDAIVRIQHVTAWIERIRRTIVPAVRMNDDAGLPIGKIRVVDPGSPGTKEFTVAVSQPDRALPPHRSLLAARVLRAPRPRIIARGVGEYASFAGLARRGFDETLRMAGAALTMVATAYTANCIGCSGFTAIGRPAGHGIVAVDPQVIPLGTRLYIPGYGRALAGDTGGAIHGNRIDLGFNSHGDAMSFGRRPIKVYVLK